MHKLLLLFLTCSHIASQAASSHQHDLLQTKQALGATAINYSGTTIEPLTRTLAFFSKIKTCADVYQEASKLLSTAQLQNIEEQASTITQQHVYLDTDTIRETLLHDYVALAPARNGNQTCLPKLQARIEHMLKACVDYKSPYSLPIPQMKIHPTLAGDCFVDTDTYTLFFDTHAAFLKGNVPTATIAAYITHEMAHLEQPELNYYIPTLCQHVSPKLIQQADIAEEIRADTQAVFGSQNPLATATALHDDLLESLKNAQKNPLFYLETKKPLEVPRFNRLAWIIKNLEKPKKVYLNLFKMEKNS